MRGQLTRTVLVFSWLLASASIAAGQQTPSGIAGVVKDASGAVLPGATVEAASPALIERVRSVVTDGTGQYKIVDLRPGTYSVTVSLTGFSTVKREGVELPAGFTATVNAELRVGAVEETINVSASSPLVDVQNTRQQNVVSSELLETQATGTRNLNQLLAFVPGMTGAGDVGGSLGTYRGTSLGATLRGKGTGFASGQNVMKVLFDGMNILNTVGSGNGGYIQNQLLVDETTIETGGVSAESNSAGVVINMVPKSGGNDFRLSFSGLFTNDNLQGNNLTDELISQGLTSPDKVLKIYDYGVTGSGPLARDRVWLFAGFRNWGNDNQIGGIYWNKTQGTPVYTPDLDRPATRYEFYRSRAARVTWQATQKDKISAFADIQNDCLCRRVGYFAPEANVVSRFRPNDLIQTTWNAVQTNKLLLEAGASWALSHWPTSDRQAGVGPNDISITESSTGFTYNAASSYSNPQTTDRYVQRFSVSYVTGAHASKFGVQIEEGVAETGQESNGGQYTYTFLNGAPSSITQRTTPYIQTNRIKADLGIYAQDQWTIRRTTINAGVRFDYLNGYVPAQHIDPTPFVPFARDYAAVHQVPDWKDISPRVGIAYDLFGTGKTAVKFAIGRYVSKAGVDITGAANPITTSVASASRTWTDANRNFIPDCDLTNQAANGECAALNNANFGKANPNANRYDPAVISGWGSRDYLWDLSAEVQHELTSTISVRGGYYRNWYSNFRVTDNTLTTSADYSPFCITAPVDSRLPNGGGYRVCGLYDVSPAKFGQVANLITAASNYGEQTQVSNFFSMGINSRFAHNTRLGAGVDTGRTVQDNCYVIDSPQQMLNCNVVNPWSANLQIKMFGSYTFPYDIVVSPTLQNLAGTVIAANYTATNAEIASSLGRNLAACGTRNPCTSTFGNIPLIAPNTMFEPRRTQLDVRLSKSFTVGRRARLQANFDVYNLNNSSAVLSVNNTYGPQWLTPAATNGVGSAGTMVNPRLFEFGAQLNF